MYIEQNVFFSNPARHLCGPTSIVHNDGAAPTLKRVWHELIFWRFVAVVRIDFTSSDKFDCFQEPVL